MTTALMPLLKCGKITLGITGTIWCCLFVLTANAQKEPFTSRLYFPALVGINIPGNGNGFTINSGLNLNTAFEYRPVYANAVFYRFNYDALNNKYQATASAAPTNVIKAKMQTAFFNVGAGYRLKVKRIGWYILAQPGLAVITFNRVLPLDNSFAVSQVSTNNFNFKLSVGAEYYIVPHFALIAEPSFYRLIGGKTPPSSSIFNINVGFTTTLF